MTRVKSRPFIIGDGLGRLATEASRGAFAGLMLSVLNDEGITELER